MLRNRPISPAEQALDLAPSTALGRRRSLGSDLDGRDVLARVLYAAVGIEIDLDSDVLAVEGGQTEAVNVCAARAVDLEVEAIISIQVLVSMVVTDVGAKLS